MADTEFIKTVAAGGGTVTISISGTLSDSSYTGSISKSDIEIVNIGTAVTSIDDEAFKDCNNIVTVSIPNNIESIGTSAFQGCAKLTSVILPNNDKFTALSESVFKGCTSLQHVTFPSNPNFTNIGKTAFGGCNNAGFTTITIPDSVTFLGAPGSGIQDAFQDCTSLTNVNMISSVNGLGLSAGPNKTVGGKSGITVGFGQTEFTKTDGTTSLVNVIGALGSGDYPGGFTASTVKRIKIGDRVTSISDQAFEDCVNMDSIALPTPIGIDSFTSIGNQAFKNCSLLKSLTMVDGVTSIGTNTFVGSGLVTINARSTNKLSLTAGANQTIGGKTGVNVFINNAPIFTSTAPTSVSEGIEYTYTVTTSDDDGDTVTVTATTIPSWLSFNTATNVLSGTPSNSDIGNHSIVLTARDSNQATETATQSFTIVVNPNQPPSFTSTPVTSVSEGVEYTYTVTTSDLNPGDIVTVIATIKPSWLSFTNNVLSGTPSNSNVGNHSIVLTATDINSASATQSFTIVVDPNQPPSFTSTPVTSVPVREPYIYGVTITDPNPGDIVTVTATKKPNWLSFNQTTNILSGTPMFDDIDSHEIVLTATDINSVTATQTFTIEVTDDSNLVSNTPIIHVLNNSITSAKNGSPLKDITSNNNMFFAMSRSKYVRTKYNLKVNENENTIKKQKQWYGNNNNSQTAKTNYVNRRVNNPQSVFNIEGKPMSNTNNYERNYVERSIQRTRAGGARVPLKVTNKNIS